MPKTRKVELDKYVDEGEFDDRFSSQFSPLETSLFVEEFSLFFTKPAYFYKNGQFDFVAFTHWLEVVNFVDITKRKRFSNLPEYIERIITYFYGSASLALWGKLTHAFTCPEDLALLNK